MEVKWSTGGVPTPPRFAKVVVSSQQFAESEIYPFKFRDLNYKGGQATPPPPEACGGF